MEEIIKQDKGKSHKEFEKLLSEDLINRKFKEKSSFILNEILLTGNCVSFINTGPLEVLLYPVIIVPCLSGNDSIELITDEFDEYSTNCVCIEVSELSESE